MLSLPAVTTRLYASDEIQYFAYLRSLWFDQDLSFENEYRHFYDRGVAKTFGFQETFLEMTTSTGLRYNFGTIGSAILWAPFYAAGDSVARIMRASGSDVAVDGYSAPYISAVTLGSAVYGFLALVLSIVAAHRIVGSGIVPALFVWFGTPLFFYMYITPTMAACIRGKNERAEGFGPRTSFQDDQMKSTIGPMTKNTSCSRTIAMRAAKQPRRAMPRIDHLSRTRNHVTTNAATAKAEHACAIPGAMYM